MRDTGPGSPFPTRLLAARPVYRRERDLSIAAATIAAETGRSSVEAEQALELGQRQGGLEVTALRARRARLRRVGREAARGGRIPADTPGSVTVSAGNLHQHSDVIAVHGGNLRTAVARPGRPLGRRARRYSSPDSSATRAPSRSSAATKICTAAPGFHCAAPPPA